MTLWSLISKAVRGKEEKKKKTALDLLGDQEEELGVLKHLRVSRKDVTLSHLCFSKFFLLAVWSMDTGRRRGGCRSNPGKRGQERISLNQITAM